jgi:hypothetical protein
MTEPIKHLEVVTYTRKGIDVLVQVDYDNGQISLVESEKGSIPTKYKGKQWVFAHRSIEYMKSWEDIFDAMKYAVHEATAGLKKHQDEADEKKVRIMARVVDQVLKPKK